MTLKTLKYLIELNVDGIITDKPKLLFDLIKRELNYQRYFLAILVITAYIELFRITMPCE